MDASDPFGDNDFGFSAPSTGGSTYGLNNLFGDEDLGLDTNPSGTPSFGLGNIFGDESFGFGSNPSDAPVSSFGANNAFGDNDLGFNSNLASDFSLDDLNNLDFDSLGKGKNNSKGFNPMSIISTLMMLNPATAPIGMAMGLGNAVHGAVTTGNMSGLAGSAIGALTGNSVLGNIAGIATNGMQGNNTSGQVGSIAGSAIGNSMGLGSLGGMLGGQIGSSLTDGMTSDGPPAGVANGSGPNIDPGMILGGLGSLYLANQNGNDAKTLANNQTPAAAQGIAGAAGVPTLESMFGPDSLYAQNMRKQLERRDAAKGRRSQYGPREVELQAKLAEMASRAAPDYIRATTAAQTAGNSNQQTVNTAQRAADEQRLKILYTLGRESGLFKELGGLFKQQPTQALPTNYLTNDWMQPAGNTDFGVQNIDTNYQPSNNFYDYGQDL